MSMRPRFTFPSYIGDEKEIARVVRAALDEWRPRPRTHTTNGTELLHPHAQEGQASRRLTIPGVGLAEIITNKDGTNEVVTLESLAPEQQAKLEQWMAIEWRQRTS